MTGLVREIESLGTRCRAATGDVSRRDDVDRVVADHVANFGGLDVIVANAGIAITAEFVVTTLEDLQRTLAINVGGVFNCYQAAAKVMTPVLRSRW